MNWKSAPSTVTIRAGSSSFQYDVCSLIKIKSVAPARYVIYPMAINIVPFNLETRFCPTKLRIYQLGLEVASEQQCEEE
jgi:hypothetical protein